MKKIITLSLFALGSIFSAQSISFKGCVPLFENQDYALIKTGTDATSRNIYATTPITGDQPCGGLGTCEFKIQWNNTNTRWEFLADSGNGDFVNPYLIYYTTKQNTTAGNPPNAAIGGWTENTAVTNGDCGGNLTESNSTFTGDVRTISLALNEFDDKRISIYPNPATEIINITGLSNVKSIKVISLEGKLISDSKNTSTVNVSKLVAGVYFLEIETENTVIKRVKFIKK
ncbi:T9SS type A sorting domain-containing protein [Halpernia frigidisoli]|uniref:Por secretion system C-terminal sorting domain-containing protein n=1 Tax=Halpernia frigidisoli TaxID=1125876 RepID=A0A1I3H377_9FLAO|nr:T9SS type A sorting domain-containing protein [Halpernia frigidisoli]SFI29997.1 Por secretion system C-terminal sorting domain-containing protein [Halpernia frigidisoli]